MSERSNLVQEMVDLHFDSDRPDDRLADRDLKLILSTKDFSQLQEEKRKMEADPEYMPTY